MPNATKSQPPKGLEAIPTVPCLHRDSMHTERFCVEWIVRFVRFHGMRLRDAFFPTALKIEVFLTDLAVHRHVAPATQNQAMNALQKRATKALAKPAHCCRPPLGNGAGREASSSRRPKFKARMVLSYTCWRVDRHLAETGGKDTLSKTFKCGQTAYA